MRKALDLYLVPARGARYVLFAATDVVQQCEQESGDRVRSSIAWLANRPTRLIAWVGRMLRSAHEYYVKLEDRIDPLERVLKAMACATELTVYYPDTLTETEAEARVRSFLRKERAKHIFWLAVDSVITVVVIALTPILMPIPGPNVFFYYPALRLLSHNRARRGAAAGLGSMPMQFKSLRDFRGLEDNLRGLDRFLERMA